MISLIIKLDFIFNRYLIKFYNRILKKNLNLKSDFKFKKFKFFFEDCIIKFY